MLNRAHIPWKVVISAPVIKSRHWNRIDACLPANIKHLPHSNIKFNWLQNFDESKIYTNQKLGGGAWEGTAAVSEKPWMINDRGEGGG